MVDECEDKERTKLIENIKAKNHHPSGLVNMLTKAVLYLLRN